MGGHRGTGSGTEEDDLYPSPKSITLDELNFTHRSHWQLAPWLTGLVLSLVVFVILIPAICSACYHWYSYKMEAEEVEEEDEEGNYESEGDTSDDEYRNDLNSKEDEDVKSILSKKNIGVQVHSGHFRSTTPSTNRSSEEIPPPPPPPTNQQRSSDLEERQRRQAIDCYDTLGKMEDPSSWLLLQNHLPLVTSSSIFEDTSSSTTHNQESSLNHLLDYIKNAKEQTYLYTSHRPPSISKESYDNLIMEIHPRKRWTPREFMEKQFKDQKKKGSYFETEV